ncbi:MAG: metallophosphoesterase [Burkholderiales bacterium]|jgi:predicted phosphodiesterase
MRIALIADTHLSARSPECVANWHAARRAVERLGADLTVNLGDITLDGQTHGDELAFASQLMQQWPTEVRCVPGNHDLGDGSGETPFDDKLLQAYVDHFGPDRWAMPAGSWKLLGINAQLLGTDAEQEAALWAWIEEQARPGPEHVHTALFLHRPMLRPLSSEQMRKGRYVSRSATERLLKGPLQPTLRMVVSGHAHQFLDTTVEGVRHLWMPSTAFILPDDMQMRIGEKLVGIGVLDLDQDAARFDLWCPDGMKRHDVSALDFFNDNSIANCNIVDRRDIGSLARRRMPAMRE